MGLGRDAIGPISEPEVCAGSLSDWHRRLSRFLQPPFLFDAIYTPPSGEPTLDVWTPTKTGRSLNCLHHHVSRTNYVRPKNIHNT